MKHYVLQVLCTLPPSALLTAVFLCLYRKFLEQRKKPLPQCADCGADLPRKHKGQRCEDCNHMLLVELAEDDTGYDPREFNW